MAIRHTCPVPGWTDHGYETVDIFAGYCEAGLDCIAQCPYSYTKEEAPQVDAATAAHFARLEAEDKARGLY